MMNGAAAGQPLHIAPGDCATGVHLVAQDIPFVKVLEQLSRVLDFELNFEGNAGRLVSVNDTRQPAELVASLSAQDSIIVAQAKDAKCPGRNRIVKVWVLPSASRTSTRDPPSTPQAQAAPSAPGARRLIATEVVIRGSADFDEQSRQAKAAFDDYVRKHGVPPPGVPEDVAKP